jgi:hypothetical protein
MKKLCDTCAKEMAVWSYMPGNGDFCENCVSRGCSCNRELTPENPDATYDGLNVGQNPPEKEFKWIKEGMVWVHTDELGREYPCCEYSYYNEGIDIEDES